MAPMTRTVLVVDDEPLVLEVIVGMLEDLGCKSLTAATAEKALGQLRRNPQIEILITDVNMPGTNGYDLADQARRMRVGLEVILLSGRETEGHGFSLLQKPFLKADLKRSMEQTSGLF
jgi:two-component system, cell cycle response regulator CpdR